MVTAVGAAVHAELGEHLTALLRVAIAGVISGLAYLVVLQLFFPSHLTDARSKLSRLMGR